MLSGSGSPSLPVLSFSDLISRLASSTYTKEFFSSFFLKYKYKQLFCIIKLKFIMLLMLPFEIHRQQPYIHWDHNHSSDLVFHQNLT